jgi:hypothetical protein
MSLVPGHDPVRGVAGYEGALASDRREDSVHAIASYCRHVGDVVAALDEQTSDE